MRSKGGFTFRSKAFLLSIGAALGLCLSVGLAHVIPFAFWKKTLSPFAITGIQGTSDAVTDTWLVNSSDPIVYFASSQGATTYDVIIKNAADTSTLCQILDVANSPGSPTGCGLTHGTSYRVHVSAKKDNLVRAASNDSFSFTMDSIAPTANTITGITGASDSTPDIWLTGGVLPQVNWNTFTNAASYDVVIKDAAGSATVCATQNTTATFYYFSSCSLINDTSYKAYVTAKSASGYNTTNASNTGFTFSVDTTIPGTFSITGITGGSDAIVDAYLADGGDPTVNYGASANVFKYDVVIKDSAGVSTICSNLDQSGSPTAVTCSLTPSTTYKAYATAKSISGFNTTPASNNGFSFNVSAPASNPPADFVITGATAGSDTMADNWLTDGVKVVANWQTSLGATSYDVTIRNAADTTDICATVNVIAPANIYNFSACTLVLNTNYLIKVIAKISGQTTNALNNGFSFKVVTATPGAFVILGASDAAASTDTTIDNLLVGSGWPITIPTLRASWAASGGATNYDVTIRNAGDTADACSLQNTANTYYDFSGCGGLSAGTDYKIKVVAKNDVGGSTTASNSLFSFHVANSIKWCPTPGSTITAQALLILDTGGPSGNYANGESCNITLSPSPAPTSVFLHFNSFASNDNNDSLSVYNSTTTTNLLGTFKNTLVAPADQTANSGNMYMTWVTGGSPSSNAAGYDMFIKAVYSTAGAFSITGATGGTDSTADVFLIDGSTVTANWGASSLATSYDVTIRNAANTADVCPTVNSATTFYTFTGCTLVESATYNIVVLAKNSSSTVAASNSPFSFQYSLKPTNFSISGVTGGADTFVDSSLEDLSAGVTAHWTDSLNETSYDVTVYEDDGLTIKCATVSKGSNITSHGFSGCTLATATFYRIKVVANNAQGPKPATNNFLRIYTGASWVPTAGSTFPRNRHTAIWTGSEMIVWGGTNGGYLNSGGRYNPTTDSWLATSTGTNLPATRYQHTATWTGSEMIVWGGNNGSDLNSGGRYNPTTDSWLATSTGTNLPAARSYQTGIWTGSEMIVWGGTNGSSLNSGGRYNPTTDSWLITSTSTNLPAIRYYHPEFDHIFIHYVLTLTC